MARFDGVLLISDFDNTLLNTKDTLCGDAQLPAVPPGNRAALEGFMAQGGRFAVATGRALPAFAAFAPQVPMNAPGVVCNGAALYDFSAGAYLETILLPPEIIPQAQAALDRFPTLAAEAYHIDNMIFAVRPNHCTRQHQHVTHVGVTEALEMAQVPLPLGKLIFEEEQPLLQQVSQWLAAQPWAERYEIFFSAPTLLEVTALGANKGEMVQRLARRLGISMEHVYCVGDESNDLSMLRCAKEGFAPMHCAPCVAGSGATLVADCDHDTLADVIRHLERRYPG